MFALPLWNWAEKLISPEEAFFLRERPQQQSQRLGGFALPGYVIGAIKPNIPSEMRSEPESLLFNHFRVWWFS